jgi:hypothetical protein
MNFDTSTVAGAAIWLVMMVLAALAFYRVKTRHKHIGAGAAGAIYGMMNEDKRNAIEIVVADKAAAHDFEHADDGDSPSQGAAATQALKEKGRDRNNGRAQS